MSNEKKKDGGQAFPYSGMERIKGPITGVESVLPVWHGGMTLRDYFAAKAMQGVATNEALRQMLVSLGKDEQDAIGKIAEAAYGMADAMLKAREE